MESSLQNTDMISDLEKKIFPTGGYISYIWLDFKQLFLTVFSERTFSKLQAAAALPAYGSAWAVSELAPLVFLSAVVTKSIGGLK